MATGCRENAFNYKPIRLRVLCIVADYTRRLSRPPGLHPAEADLHNCALACASKPDCRAFNVAAPLCSLYVWSRCGGAVRKPNCTAATSSPEAINVTVYVKSGANCPADYRAVNATGGYRGNRYKYYPSTNNWTVQAAQCLADGDLTRPAQLDTVEDIDAVSIAYGGPSGAPVWTGAFQLANSSEPSGGWYWYPCAGPQPPALPVQPAVWESGQPNDNGGAENVGVMLQSRLSDYPESSNYPVVCQCWDPFYLA